MHAQLHNRASDVVLCLNIPLGLYIVCEQRRLWQDCGCAGSPEPLLVAYVISTLFTWAGSIIDPIQAIWSSSSFLVILFYQWFYEKHWTKLRNFNLCSFHLKGDIAIRCIFSLVAHDYKDRIFKPVRLFRNVHGSVGKYINLSIGRTSQQFVAFPPPPRHPPPSFSRFFHTGYSFD